MTRVLVVGDVVDDISVKALAPTAAASDTTARIRMRPGGSAANVAAWLGHLGVECTFVGRVGADGVERHEAALAEHGVRAMLAADTDLPTATIVLQLDDVGERTMFVDRGANTSLRVDDVPEVAWDGVGWLHLTGYTWFDPATRPVADALVAQAEQRGVGVSVDPSTVSFLRDCGGPTFLRWVAGVDLLFPNLEEARVLVDARGPHVDLDALADGVGALVVTLGPMGAAFVERRGDVEPRREQVTAPRSPVVDTTGAGDAFAAGFLSVWTVRREPVAALEAGRAAAERCIAAIGARP
ncbi:sugar kinase [Aeromicrobium halocynthiae]|uniref:Sugar kinase n=1 Tax=Aeromicrobium halocynthiae TaxID=560557 RepID=A0ABN2VWJ1_9ACTN